MLHSCSADTGFDLVTQLPFYFTPRYIFSSVPPAFSADGLKFAVTSWDGTMTVWDVRSKIPLMIRKIPVHGVDSLHFSSGTLGREVLALTAVSQLYLDVIFFMLNESA